MGADAPALVACRGVTVAYGSGDARVVALDHVDISLSKGERVALWGPSGSGKTTLIHVLGGLVEPSDGVVLWRGASVAGPAASATRRTRVDGISHVPQGSDLVPVFTAYENVAFATYVSGERREVEKRALDVLTLVGLGAKADHLPSELSGGELQRVAIARALSQRPQLLLCDEPTGHLDADTSSRVLELIDALREQLGFTLVVATHDADIAATCSRVVELADGRIVSDEA